MSTQQRTVFRLTESAVMLAFSSVLSMIKLVDMPYGGSITAFSMLPLLIIAYRYGTGWGLLTALTHGFIQLLLGMDNFSYATSFTAVVMILLFDYLLAFVVLGLGGLFRRPSWSQGQSLAVSAVFTGIGRYLCHTVSGCTVWAGLSVPTVEALLYSLSYNATYMIPEILILVLGGVYLSRFVSFGSATITRAPALQKTTAPAAAALSVISKTVLLATAVWVVVLIAPTMQSTETGALFLAGLAAVRWDTVGIVAAVGMAVFTVAEVIAHRLKHRS